MFVSVVKKSHYSEAFWPYHNSQHGTPFLRLSDVVSYITKLIHIVTNFLSCFKNYQCKENFEPHHLHCSDSDCFCFMTRSSFKEAT